MTNDPQTRTLKRRFVVVVIGGITAVVGIAIAWRIDADNRRAEACESKVEEAKRDRAMWVWLLDNNDDPTNPKAIAFSAELDRQIPLLRCERGSAIPIPAHP